MITTSVKLGPLTFDDFAETGWAFKDLVDWWGGASDKSEVVERPQAHGAFDVSNLRRASRAISLQVIYIGASQADVENAFDTLAGIGAEAPELMVVTTPAGRTARSVTVERVTVLDHRGQKFGQFARRAAVDLIARDPRRYSLPDDVPWLSTSPASPGAGVVWPAVWPLVWPGGGSSGRIVLTNVGKAPSAPTFRLSGGFASALITCAETGARIGLDRAVPAGSVVEIDTAAHRAVIDGQSDVGRWLRWREWELVPPGASRTYQFDVTGAAGSPLMQGRVLSAWW